MMHWVMSTSASHTFGSLASSSAGGRRGNFVDEDEDDDDPDWSDELESEEDLAIGVEGALDSAVVD